jgi:hypothetical protein
MRPCPRCGSACPDEAAICAACGGALVPAGLGQTFVGHRAPDAPLPGAERPAPEAAFKGTMLGIAPLGPTGGPPENAAPAPVEPGPATSPMPGHSLKSTMLGFGPLAPPGAPPSPLGQTISMSGGVPKGTLLGMAPADLPPPPPAGPPGAPAEPPPGSFVPGKRTIMGVARPGIAPLNPGTARPAEATQPAPAWSPLPSPPPPPPASGTLDVTDAAPEKAKNPRIPVIAALVIVAAAALFTAAGVVLLLYRARGAISATVSLGADGREALALVCEGCDDGALVRFGSARANFAGRRATLRLEKPLAVGDNKLPLVLERRPGKPETVELVVPVEFRVRGDTAELAKSPPAITIVANAVKGSAVVIDGKAVTLGPDGAATLSIDVSRALTGSDPAAKTLEHRVKYTVTPPGSAPKRGEVIVRVGITPLVLQAPGESIVLDSATFVLAGRTAKDGSVSVEGRAITVDPSGQFAQVMGVSAEGETTIVVRAASPDRAPRLVPVRVRRVASLAAEAERVRPQATGSYAAIATPTDAQRGMLVLFDGTVLEARVESFTTVFLMETKSGCAAPPCRLRVTWGSKSALVEGEPVTIFGALSGAVDGPRSGTRIPSITASFVTKRRP